MDRLETIKILKRAISNIRKNRSRDALNELEKLMMHLERKVKEDDFDNTYDDYLVDDSK